MCTRAGLSGIPETLGRFDPSGGADALLQALDHEPTIDGHTTNVTVADGEGSACVLTSSLGLGSGDWLPGLDVHLNSMLGETDLVRGPLRPGTRMESMMAPTLVFDGDRTRARDRRGRRDAAPHRAGRRSRSRSARRPRACSRQSTGRASIRRGAS